jgi:hypothetical protein
MCRTWWTTAKECQPATPSPTCSSSGGDDRSVSRPHQTNLIHTYRPRLCTYHLRANADHPSRVEWYIVSTGVSWSVSGSRSIAFTIRARDSQVHGRGDASAIRYDETINASTFEAKFRATTPCLQECRPRSFDVSSTFPSIRRPTSTPKHARTARTVSVIALHEGGANRNTYRKCIDPIPSP